jgi:hypothetical protein
VWFVAEELPGKFFEICQGTYLNCLNKTFGQNANLISAGGRKIVGAQIIYETCLLRLSWISAEKNAENN